MRNADAIWSYSRDISNHLGLHWDGPFDEAQTHNQIPAMDALNAAISFNNLEIAVKYGIQRQKYPAPPVLAEEKYLHPAIGDVSRKAL
jgi:hypothetical protein